VVEDLPSNTHFHFDMIASLNTLNQYLRPIWVSHNVYTYIKIKEDVDYKKLDSNIDKLIQKYAVPQISEYLDIPVESFLDGTNKLDYKLQPIRKIHLTSNLENELEPNGKSMYIYAFIAISLFILLIACLNFINMTTANSANRAREVVLRKVIGSGRKSLIAQFLIESVIICLISLVLALIIVEIGMPYFNNYLDINLQLRILNNPLTITLIILATILLGVVAGSYPAFFISSYEPLKIMHGNLNSGLRNQRIRAIFVTIQLSISILIIILTMVVFAQLDYMMNKELGFKKERILVIRRPDALKERLGLFKNDILDNPNIESVSNSNSIPGRDFLTSTFILENDTLKRYLIMNQIFVNYDFREAFELDMIEGRFFSRSIISDTAACVINEEAARQLEEKNILGATMLAPALKSKMGNRLKIIGIVKNFHFETVDKKIDPLIITLMPGNWEGYLTVRLSSNEIDKSIRFLEETWKQYTSQYPFQYFFLDQDFDRNYRSVMRIAKIFLIFASLSIILACLGLFGLMLFSTNQRMQEIGIRKAIGASYLQIIVLLIRETALLNIIATVFAWITAFLISLFWLKAFYSRITLSPRYFIYASIIVFVLSILAVFYQALRGSMRSPAAAFKSE
jgi:putative ABC transport system permease protein